MTYLKVLLRMSQENRANHVSSSVQPDQGLKWVPPIYKPTLLPLHQTV